MASGDGIAMAGVGIGVLLVVFDQTTAGIAFMLLGVVGGVIFAASGSDDRRDRGQAGIDLWVPVSIFMTILVAMFVIIEIQARIAGIEPGQIEGLCSVPTGCGGVYYDGQLISAFAIVLLLAISLRLIRWKYGDKT